MSKRYNKKKGDLPEKMDIKDLLYKKWASEKDSAAIERFLDETSPKSDNELKEILEGFYTNKSKYALKRELTPAEKAQNLMYDAWAEPDKKKRIKMAKKALEISQDCPDAYYLLAEYSDDVKEAEAFFEKGVKAGERLLGEDFIKSKEGNFWKIVRTRPYMRALFGYANALSFQGKREEAIKVYQRMLTLNPSDNQGARYQLLIELMRAGMKDKVEELFKKYEDEGAPDWLYNKALWNYIVNGDTPDSEKLLEDALNSNPYFIVYMAGIKKLPRTIPKNINNAKESEAVSYIYSTYDIWNNAKGAWEWLLKTSSNILNEKYGKDVKH
ncbi:MAG: tetratricopeptide repeat protein [Thermoplasmata archaeon]